MFNFLERHPPFQALKAREESGSPDITGFLHTSRLLEGKMFQMKCDCYECFPWKEVRFGYQIIFPNTLMCALGVKCQLLWMKLCGPGACLLKLSTVNVCHLTFARCQFSWLKNNTTNDYLGFFKGPNCLTQNNIQQPDCITHFSHLLKLFHEL